MIIPITLFALTLTILGFGAEGTKAEEEATQVQASDEGWIWLDMEADPEEPATSPASESTDERGLTSLDPLVWETLPDGRGSGGINKDGSIYACDDNPDNWGVRTHYITSNSGEDHVGDGNGSEDGCGIEFPFDGSSVIAFRVCAGVNGADTVCKP
jgi:hypothetical protein